MIDHEKIIKEQQIDQEYILATEAPDPEDDDELETLIFSELEEYNDGEERFFEREFSIQATKIA